MTSADIVGMVGALFTTVSFVPQVYKIFVSRKAHDISLPMYIIFTIGVFFWFAYGVMTKSLPVIIANGITVVLSLLIITMKVRYK